MTHLKELGVETLVLDTTKTEDIQSAVSYISQATDGTLDILFNNAGRYSVGPFLHLDIEDMRKLFDVDFFAVAAMTQAFTPMLLASRGMVVNHASVMSFLHTPGAGAYCAAKAALSALSDVMRLEFAPLGIRVVLLPTGAVQSNILKNVDYALPPSSPYAPIKDQFEASMMAGDVKDKRLPAELFAKQVVSSLVDVKRPAAYIYAGPFVNVARFITTFIPSVRLLDWLLGLSSGMNSLAGKLKQA